MAFLIFSTRFFVEDTMQLFCLPSHVKQNEWIKLVLKKIHRNHFSFVQKIKFKKMFVVEKQVVDMRWGVRDEATDDHMTTELCMREIVSS